MRPDLRDLLIEEMIIHDLPKKFTIRQLREHEDEEESPVFSEVPSPLDADIRDFFRGKIIDSITSSKSMDILFDDANETCVKNLIIQYFSDFDHHIEPSCEIAQHLFDSQNAQNSSGLLVFIASTCCERKIISILKLEKEEGVRLEQQRTYDQEFTFGLEFIHNLILTQKTKLFKIVLFYEENEVFKGIICDNQRGYYNQNDVADFFIKDFLGCKMAQHQSELTRDFFKATEEFINTRMTSPEKKGNALTHLLSELNNQDDSINTRVFANHYLEPRERDAFETFLVEKNIPIGSFLKDISLIEKKIKRINYAFESGISVLGSKEAIEDKVTISDNINGGVELKVTDMLKSVKTK